MKRSSPPLIYTIESSLCNIRVIRDVPRVQRALESKQSVFRFVDTGDTPDRHVVADLLDYVFSEEYFESPIDFKIFLPDGYGALIAPHRTLQIVWMPEQLEQLMQARLRWASDGKRTRLAQYATVPFARKTQMRRSPAAPNTAWELLDLLNVYLLFMSPREKVKSRCWT